MTSPNTIIADMQLIETNLRQQIAHLNDEIAGLKSDVAYVEKQRDALLECMYRIEEDLIVGKSDDLTLAEYVRDEITRWKGGS